MISIGFVTLYPNQELAYATELAKRAPEFGIELFRFTPTSIEPTTEMARGEKYNHTTNTGNKACSKFQCIYMTVASIQMMRSLKKVSQS